ncbi:MAG TPA: DNA-3-methyladenine glycosylase [Terriglobales bacterium]|nr:DNA-3-methyladenine glycosylase [Terriglobales bacterium]
MTRTLLPRSFFERDPRIVAKELLGKLLVRRMGRTVIAARIVETEAYLGERDLAAHASSGITPRNAVLFGPAGHAYVYFTYGMYHCMNISCEKAGQPGCVLLRALEPLSGWEEMALGRHLALPDEPDAKALKLLTSGPGRLCQALHINRADDNGKDVTSAKSDLQAAADDFRVKRVVKTERIGISQDTHLKLRYLIADNPFVSGKAVSSRKVEKPTSFSPPAPPKRKPSHTSPALARKPLAPRVRPVRTRRTADAG